MKSFLFFIFVIQMTSSFAAVNTNSWKLEYKDGACFLSHFFIGELNQSDDVSISLNFVFFTSQSKDVENFRLLNLDTHTHILGITASVFDRVDRKKTTYPIDVVFNNISLQNRFENYEANVEGTSVPFESMLIGDEALNVLEKLQQEDPVITKITPVGAPGISIEINKGGLMPKGKMYIACAENAP